MFFLYSEDTKTHCFVVFLFYYIVCIFFYTVVTRIKQLAKVTENKFTCMISILCFSTEQTHLAGRHY